MTNSEKKAEKLPDDVSLKPGHGSDRQSEVEKYISKSVRDRYDVYSYRHASSIFANSYPQELSEIENALDNFSMTTTEIGLPGGNESIIPKRFDSFFRPNDWYETRVEGDLVVRVAEKSVELLEDGRRKKTKLPEKEPYLISNYIDGHQIDYVKGKVALDLEWNSKDQTFDRDLFAFRMFYECGVISAAAIITRSEKLNPVFETTPKLNKDGTNVADKDGNIVMCKDKFGASTTWMGKLLYRLNSGRNGGCPVLVFGIRPEVITDLRK